MRSLARTITISTLLLGLAGVAAEGAAQDRGGRRAQPRERAPRSEPAAAPAPARQQPAARSRGTDDQGRVRAPRDQDGGSGRSAVRAEPRERAVARSAPAPETTTRTDTRTDERRVERRREAEPSPAPATSAAPPAVAASNGAARSDGSSDEQRRAVPRGSRPRDDNPAVGRAVPRDRVVTRDGRGSGNWGGGSRVYTSRGRIYGGRVYNNYYYYYPRRWYPYGYGAFGGLGYFYYDPYTWYSYDPYWSRPHHYRYYGSHGYGDSYYATGELRLQVHPRHAEVYVDGYFAGHVDDFDGIFQALRLEEGAYKIEIVAPGFETLVFDVRILPGRKTTYRGDLLQRP